MRSEARELYLCLNRTELNFDSYYLSFVTGLLYDNYF